MIHLPVNRKPQQSLSEISVDSGHPDTVISAEPLSCAGAVCSPPSSSLSSDPSLVLDALDAQLCVAHCFPASFHL